MRYDLITPPAVSPVTLAETKVYLDVTYDDRDDLIQMLINGATALVERVFGLALITQTREYYTSGPPLDLLVLPAQSITSVYYRNAGVWTLIDSDTYQINDTKRALGLEPQYGESWPVTMTDYKTRVVVGYGDAATDVPDDIRQAILMICNTWFDEPSASAPTAALEIVEKYRVAAF